ncbi:PAS domain-containing protein [Polaribacter batillariae]|uniref:PAS domain-containing protein n=1 Tax=Polaribacter batillariae TaxID=2808900 RepID=A0ABX7STH9_9FLAO|nr:PAS domain-containing protein [Polaribacter batillariae]QTD37197.1 PAS domain-containing protein [Polaribacter batillariae]
MKNKLANMACLDLFLNSQETKDYTAIKELITPTDSKKLPLISFDLYRNHFFSEMELLDIKNDVNQVKELAFKFNWKNNFDYLFKDQKFEAIVITDLHKNIVWVNEGFTKMSGFSKNFALKKTPSFLQGEETSIETKKRIREKIAKNRPFTEVIINYKKDKTPYKCELKIFPLYSEETTHFIALERSVASF